MEWGEEREEQRSISSNSMASYLAATWNLSELCKPFSWALNLVVCLKKKKKNCNKNEAQSILSPPMKQSTVCTPYVQPFTSTLHALSSYRQSFCSPAQKRYAMTLNTAQHIREEQNGTSPFERSQLSPSHTESPVALWMCQSESIIFISSYTLEIITGGPFVVFVYAFLLIKSYGRIQQRLLNCSSWKIDAALKDFFVSRRYWENTGVKATWERMFYSHAWVTGGTQKQ